MCRALKVSASGYYDWRERPPSQRSVEDARLLVHIRRAHEESREAYGGVKTWKALTGQGIACGKHRVARLRRANGIEAKRRTRFKITTKSKPRGWRAPDRVQRSFIAEAPNQVWAGDVAYLATRRGWLYLAILLDLYSRKVVGWSMSERNNEALVLMALEMALGHRQPEAGLVHHTDQGQLYAAKGYRRVMEENGLLASMGRKGDCYDNAVSESFFSTLKNELTHGRYYDSREQARTEIFEYIEVFYNRQRLHQTLGYKTPVEYEELRGA